ncbi:hypothetical protein HPG69_011333, partial [Diceros bicornis minor]
MLYSCPGSTHLWPAKRNRTLKMKHLLPQFRSILVIYCFCMLQISSSGFPQPLADPPDGLDVGQLERLAYWATCSRQPKIANLFSNIPVNLDDQDVHKRFLFHYCKSQEPTHPVKTGFLPVHPLMRLAAKLANRRMKKFLQRDLGAAAVDLTRK